MESEVKISQFIDEEGRVTQLPRKQKPRRAVLEYLSEKFERDCVYTEHQVNSICEQWHTFGDFFTLRRELIESGLLCRERDGSKYWRPEKEPVNETD